MKTMVLVMLLIAVYSTATMPQEQGNSSGTNHRPDEKIYDGEVVTDFINFKYMVTIQVKNPDRPEQRPNHVCGGSLVSLSIVVTAAHCLAFINNQTGVPQLFSTRRYVFIAGSVNQLFPEPQTYQQKTASLFLIDERYKAMPFIIYDCGIAKMTEPFMRTPDVDILEIPSRLNADDYRKKVKELLANHTECVFAGWGLYRQGSTENSDVLRMAYLTSVSNRNCVKVLSGINPRYANFSFAEHDQICFRGREPNIATGDGDSGGPVVCKGKIVAVLSNRVRGIAIFQEEIVIIPWLVQQRGLPGDRRITTSVFEPQPKSGVGIISPNVIFHISVANAVLAKDTF